MVLFTANRQMIEQQGHDHVVNLGNVPAKIAVTLKFDKDRLTREILLVC